MTSYDEFAYPSLPLHPTQPDRMATQAALLGCRYPDPARARVLEIGCSDAGNLAWLAAYAPESEFVGIDLSEAAVARAQVAVAELPNLSVRQGDLTHLSAGEFDYVIAHGVYSWIPQPQALLACIAAHLAPAGLAYVSYNTLPGSHVRALAGDVLRRVARGAADPLAAAQSVGAWIMATSVDTTHARMMREAMGLALAKPAHVLVHDELAEANTAVHLDQFVAQARSFGLEYLGESHLADSDLAGVRIPPELAPMGADEVARQQLLDYARNRAFRQTLLVRRGNEPATYSADPTNLESLFAAAPARITGRASGRVTVAVLAGVELTTDNAALVADLELLGSRWPESVPVSQLRSDRAALLAIYRGRGLELRTAPVPCVMPGVRPRVVPYARSRAAAGGVVASSRHEILNLQDRASRQAVASMDGQHTRRQISALLRSAGVATATADRDLDTLLTELGSSGLMLG